MRDDDARCSRVCFPNPHFFSVRAGKNGQTLGRRGGESIYFAIHKLFDWDKNRHTPFAAPRMQETCAKHPHLRPLSSYRPTQAEYCARRRAEFDAALSEIEAASATRESHPQLYARIDAVRAKRCLACRETLARSAENPTTVKGKCRRAWREMRARPCVDCGRADGVQFDHISERGEKVRKLSDVDWWAVNGGVEAMHAEAVKCDPRCANCHRTQPTHSAYMRKYATVEEMPESTTLERIQKRSRRYKDEKLAYVRDRKIEIGECADCGMRVTPEASHVFEFAHRDAAQKRNSVSRFCTDRKSLTGAMPLIDAEMAKCRLLCACCHSQETRERNATPFTRAGGVLEIEGWKMGGGSHSGGKTVRLWEEGGWEG